LNAIHDAPHPDDCTWEKLEGYEVIEGAARRRDEVEKKPDSKIGPVRIPSDNLELARG
jgi:hypothetical protein